MIVVTKSDLVNNGNPVAIDDGTPEDRVALDYLARVNGLVVRVSVEHQGSPRFYSEQSCEKLEGYKIDGGLSRFIRGKLASMEKRRIATRTPQHLSMGHD